MRSRLLSAHSRRILRAAVVGTLAAALLAGVTGQSVAQAGPPEVDLILTKTVGTDPDVCATTSEIQVPIGTQVVYCYTLTNNSDFIILRDHSVVDDRLGVILDHHIYDLMPGESVFVTKSAIITADVTNTATWNV